MSIDTKLKECHLSRSSHDEDDDINRHENELYLYAHDMQRQVKAAANNSSNKSSSSSSGNYMLPTSHMRGASAQPSSSSTSSSTTTAAAQHGSHQPRNAKVSSKIQQLLNTLKVVKLFPFESLKLRRNRITMSCVCVIRSPSVARSRSTSRTTRTRKCAPTRDWTRRRCRAPRAA